MSTSPDKDDDLAASLYDQVFPADGGFLGQCAANKSLVKNRHADVDRIGNRFSKRLKLKVQKFEKSRQLTEDYSTVTGAVSL